MVTCKKCGKKFQTIQALNDHFRAMHPNERFEIAKQSATRKLAVGLVIVIILVGALVGYLIFIQLNQPTSHAPGTELGLIGQAIPSPISANLSGVSYSTLSTIGKGGATAPSAVTGSPLVLNGKPEVLYIGADYCPYCAAERWSMIVALSKFGNFSGVEYMLSSSTDAVAPNTATFSFSGATYTSQYISFVGVEQLDRSGQTTIQTLTTDQGTLMHTYDPSLSIPFLDLGNQYVMNGAQYQPSTLAGMNWTQIASQLNNPNSSVAKAIDGAANTLITTICKIDGGTPSSVCGQSFANVSLTALNSTLSTQNLFDSILQINTRN